VKKKNEGRIVERGLKRRLREYKILHSRELKKSEENVITCPFGSNLNGALTQTTERRGRREDKQESEKRGRGSLRAGGTYKLVRGLYVKEGNAVCEQWKLSPHELYYNSH